MLGTVLQTGSSPTPVGWRLWVKEDRMQIQGAEKRYCFRATASATGPAAGLPVMPLKVHAHATGGRPRSAASAGHARVDGPGGRPDFPRELGQRPGPHCGPCVRRQHVGHGASRLPAPLSAPPCDTFFVAAHRPHGWRVRAVQLFVGNQDIDGQHSGLVWDSLNNAEQVALEEVAKDDLLLLSVRGPVVPQAPQPFALVATGLIEPVEEALCDGVDRCVSGCGELPRLPCAADGISPPAGADAGRGTCTRGQCRCTAGYAGTDCSITVAQSILSAQQTSASVSGTLDVHGWAFAGFTIGPELAGANLVRATCLLASRALPRPRHADPALQSVSLLRTSGTGDPDLFGALSARRPAQPATVT